MTAQLTTHSSQYANIKPIFFEKNSGHPSYPRNAALKEVTSPYIIFLDSDDELYDDYCEVMYDLINANDVDIVNCNHTSKINDELYIPTDIEEINHSTAILNDDEKLFINPTVWGNIFRTSFFRENNINFLHILFEDLVFTVFCAIKTKKEIIYLPNYPGYIYFIENDKSITHKVHRKTLTDFLKSMTLIHSLLKENSTNQTKMKLMNDLINIAFFILAKLENKSEGIKLLYDFEKSLDFKLEPTSLPFKMLNNLIMKKRFKLSLMLIKIMDVLYNNKKMRNLLFIKYSGVKKVENE